MGPWQQAELIRDIRKAERARFRRLVRRELQAIEGADANNSDGEQALHRILAAITPPKASA